MTHPPNQNEFVRMATNGLFVAILAFGLNISSHVLLPLTDFLVYPIMWYKAIILALPYIVIISSWVNFMKSVNKDPYTIGMWGTSRFVLDLIILLIYYLLLSVVSNNDESDDNQIFVLIPMVFLLYSIWDFFKEREHRKDPEKLKNIKRRTKITAKYSLAAGILSGIYFIAYIKFFSLNWNDVEFWINTLNFHVDGWTQHLSLNIIFAVIFAVLVIMYRLAKGDTQRHRRSA